MRQRAGGPPTCCTACSRTNATALSNCGAMLAWLTPPHNTTHDTTRTTRSTHETHVGRVQTRAAAGSCNGLAGGVGIQYSEDFRKQCWCLQGLWKQLFPGYSEEKQHGAENLGGDGSRLLGCGSASVALGRCGRRSGRQRAPLAGQRSGQRGAGWAHCFADCWARLGR